jgi:hypothetical protein
MQAPVEHPELHARFIDAFDRLVSASDLSLADVRRHRVLPEPEGNA